jgi:hypothetical protein
MIVRVVFKEEWVDSVAEMSEPNSLPSLTTDSATSDCPSAL